MSSTWLNRSTMTALCGGVVLAICLACNAPVAHGRILPQMLLVTANTAIIWPTWTQEAGQTIPFPANVAGRDFPVCSVVPTTSNYVDFLRWGSPRVRVRVPGLAEPLYGVATTCAVPQDAQGPGSRMYRIEIPQQYIDATSKDTVRSRSFTGKPCRMLRNDWTDAWENPENPKPLGMPMQFMITGEAVARGHQYPDQAKDVQFNPVGQVVGQMNKIRRTKDVIFDMVNDYIEAAGHLNSTLVD